MKLPENTKIAAGINVGLNGAEMIGVLRILIPTAGGDAAIAELSAEEATEFGLLLIKSAEDLKSDFSLFGMLQKMAAQITGQTAEVLAPDTIRKVIEFQKYRTHVQRVEITAQNMDVEELPGGTVKVSLN